jgi:hypothetical protein
MAYSEEKLKINGDKASLCFEPFCIEDASDFYLTRNLLQVSFTYIFN